MRVVLTLEERTELERRLRCTTTPSGLARRSRVILGVADGLPLVEVARLVGMTEKHVRKWTTRYLKSQQFPLNLSCEKKTICNILFGNWLWQQPRSSYCTLSMLLVL